MTSRFLISHFVFCNERTAPLTIYLINIRLCSNTFRIRQPILGVLTSFTAGRKSILLIMSGSCYSSYSYCMSFFYSVQSDESLFYQTATFCVFECANVSANRTLIKSYKERMYKINMIKSDSFNRPFNFLQMPCNNNQHLSVLSLLGVTVRNKTVTVQQIFACGST